MKHSFRSLTPSLVPALALVLFSALASAQHYQQTNLVSNVPVTPAASVSDPNLQNAWGLVHGPGTPWWISNNAGGTSTLYNTSGLNPANPSGQTPPPVLAPVSIVALNAPGGTAGNGVMIANAPGQPVFRDLPLPYCSMAAPRDFQPLLRASPRPSCLSPKTVPSRAGTRA